MKSIRDYILEAYKSLLKKKYDDVYKNALWNYVAGYVTDVNAYLRKNKYKDVKYIVDDIDSAFAELGSRGKIDVYRTVDWKYMHNMYNIDRDNIYKHIGDVLQNKGYMSTTLLSDKSPWGEYWLSDDLVLHITSTKPYNYISINDVFKPSEIDCSDQEEILLPRDTKLRIDSIGTKSGCTYKDNIDTFFIEMSII